MEAKRSTGLKSTALGIISMVMVLTLQAQKKVVPVSQSALTGMTLPADSKKDSRFLSEISGRTLLEMETKKVGTSVRTLEILSLPSVAKCGFNADSFITSVSALGWNLASVEGDDKFVWLQKGNVYIIAYFSMGKNSTEVYFGEVDAVPAITMTADNTQVNQEIGASQPAMTTTQVTTTTEIPSEVTTTTPVNPPAAIQDGFAFTTTNFDDGWTSTVYNDYVLSTKGDIKVYLSYIEKFNASDYSGTGKELRHHYWDNYVGKYFITGEKKFDTRGALSDYSQDFIEGWATDKETGSKRYIAMIVQVIAYTGTLSVIVVSAPDEQQFRRQFPKADTKFENDLLPMYSYNKFALGKNDLIGKWVSGAPGAMVNWYSTATGNNVGSTAAVTSDEFDFGSDGKYSSKHNGATGWVGAMNTFQQKYNGTYTVTDWTLTATNRFDGKTEVLNAWFEVVRGGRVLHLQNQQYTGQTMMLMKVK